MSGELGASFRWLALLACGLAGTAQGQDSGVYVPHLDCVGGRFGLQLPKDLREVKRLAPLQREERGEVTQWPGYTTTRTLLHFEGLSLEVIEFSNDPARYRLTFAWVDSPAWNTLTPFKIRQPIERAAAVLGRHARENPGLTRPFEDEGNTLTIRSTDGRVTGVTYECYPG